MKDEKWETKDGATMDWTLEQSPLKLVFAWRSFSKDGVSQWIPLLKEAHNGLTGGAQIG